MVSDPNTANDNGPAPKIVGLSNTGPTPMCVHVDGHEHPAPLDSFGTAMLDPECAAGPDIEP
ncbi:hypothetical protein [Jiangella gansuensis]|uniref:hypothetical protein n=1 Tax=Jiangella gansuensis TaxID=281473 RepID=UPI00047930E7|nr:hypothetical protein [Jiangella gansuensis]